MIIAAAAGSLFSESVQGTGYGKRPFRGFPLIIDVSVVLALLLYRLVWTLSKYKMRQETGHRERD